MKTSTATLHDLWQGKILWVCVSNMLLTQLMCTQLPTYVHHTNTLYVPDCMCVHVTLLGWIKFCEFASATCCSNIRISVSITLTCHIILLVLCTSIQIKFNFLTWKVLCEYTLHYSLYRVLFWLFQLLNCQIVVLYNSDY